MKERLRRETHGTAVGGDRGADRPVACRRGGPESARVAVGAGEARPPVDYPARGSIPCVGPATCAGGLEERRVEPGVDRILGMLVAVCVPGANEGGGLLVVGVRHGDGGEATEA